MFIRLALFFLLANHYLPGAQVVVRIIEQPVVEERFDKLRSSNAERAAVIRQLFNDAGCVGEYYSEPAVKHSKLPNLICALPGTSTKTIVVGAHYDNAGPGEGAIDNWAGAVLLPSLFESLRTVQRSVTFVFIAFTDEEKGLIGSRDYADHLPKDRRPDIIADVNIDSIGLAGPIRVWATRADKSLTNAAALVANSLKIAIGGMNVDNVGDSDSHPFLERKIPVIDFHSLTSQTLSLLHSKRDVRAVLDPMSYYDTYRFLATYLAYVDSKAEEGFSSTSRAPAR